MEIHKSKFWRVLGTIVIAILSLLGFVFLCLCVYVWWAIRFGDDTDLQLIRMESPTKKGTAFFAADRTSWAGTSYWFYVTDPTAPNPQSVLVGGPYATDGDVDMQNASWSKDGSIVAVRAQVGESAGHNFSKSYGTFFVAAYDFNQHTLVASDRLTRQKSYSIKALMAQHGGIGANALTNTSQISQRMSNAQREQFNLK